MPYTETTKTSWFSRVGGSFGGMGFALVLFIAATCLLYWNEGRTVRTGGAINEAMLMHVAMDDISKVDPDLNGKVVYATGKADTQDVLEDTALSVKTPGPAIKLARSVMYYQWVETSKQETKQKLGGSEETVTVYYYDKKWVDSPVDSKNFHDFAYQNSNKVITTLEDEDFTAENVSFGAYTLPKFLKNSISGAQPFTPTLSDEQLKALDSRIKSTTKSTTTNYYTFSRKVRLNGNDIYFGTNPSAPEIGDMRVSYTQTLPADISIIAKVIDNTFETFRASNGATFSKLSMGTQSAENMFGAAKSSNNTMAWILRVIGTILVMAAIKMFLAPLSVVASVVPLFGNIVGAGTGLVGTLLGLAWALIIIAVSWIRFRPILAFGLIAVAVIAVVLVIIRGHKKSAPAA